MQFGSWSQNAKQGWLPWGFFLSVDIPDALQEGSENFDNWKSPKGKILKSQLLSMTQKGKGKPQQGIFYGFH